MDFKSDRLLVVIFLQEISYIAIKIISIPLLKADVGKPIWSEWIGLIKLIAFIKQLLN